MPAADAVLLPLCLGLTLLGLLVVIIAGRRGRRGRVLQGLALSLAPVALYFSGLLRLVWNGLAAVVGWASQIVFSPAVWFGLSLLAVCVVLWVLGAAVVRRGRGSRPTKQEAKTSQPQPAALSTGSRTGPAAGSKPRAKPPAKPAVDDDMAEIEALLKSRGIE